MGPIEILITVVVGVACLALGGFLGIIYRKKVAEAEIGSAEEKAKKIIADSAVQVETMKKEALLEAKAAGKIGHIGITAHSLDVFARALECDWVETIMFPYNIVEKQGEHLIRKCREKNIGFVCMKPLAGGAIENGTLDESRFESYKKIKTEAKYSGNAADYRRQKEQFFKNIAIGERKKRKDVY